MGFSFCGMAQAKCPPDCNYVPPKPQPFQNDKIPSRDFPDIDKPWDDIRIEPDNPRLEVQPELPSLKSQQPKPKTK
jgi:hypothetical protein